MRQAGTSGRSCHEVALLSTTFSFDGAFFRLALWGLRGFAQRLDPTVVRSLGPRGSEASLGHRAQRQLRAIGSGVVSRGLPASFALGGKCMVKVFSNILHDASEAQELDLPFHVADGI